MTEHTPEPWAPCDNPALLVSDRKEPIATFHGPDRTANMRRVLACVNAMLGISTEDLEKCPDLRESGVYLICGDETLAMRTHLALKALDGVPTSYLEKLAPGALVHVIEGIIQRDS